MTTVKQIAANQANALKSTGPRTAEGKAVSRANAVRHGALAQVVVVEGEDADDFGALLGALKADLSPVGALEEALVEKVAMAIWRGRRLIAAESAAARLRQRPDKLRMWRD